MTIVMPHDVIDSEIYIKPPRGPTGLQMDPWLSSTWRRTWGNSHSPNQATEEEDKKIQEGKNQKKDSVYIEQLEEADSLSVNIGLRDLKDKSPSSTENSIITPIVWELTPLISSSSSI